MWWPHDGKNSKIALRGAEDGCTVGRAHCLLEEMPLMAHFIEDPGPSHKAAQTRF